MINTRLNERLIEKQRLTEGDIAELYKLHETKDKLFTFISDFLDPHEDKDQLRLMAELLEAVEYSMQRVWKFTQDSSFHTHWLDLPYCTCPDMDNRERIGTPYIIYNQDCPIHGIEE